MVSLLKLWPKNSAIHPDNTKKIVVDDIEWTQHSQDCVVPTVVPAADRISSLDEAPIGVECSKLNQNGTGAIHKSSEIGRTDAYEHKMTPQDGFHHLQQLEKLYKNDALTEEQYTKSRERLWTKIAGGGQSPSLLFKTEASQTAKKVLELQHLDRLLQLCQDGAITEKQYNRARDRIIINGQHGMQKER